jgi:hypothetical protein
MSDTASNQIAVESSEQYLLLDSYDSVVRNINDLLYDVRKSFFKLGEALFVARSKCLYILDSCVDVYDWGEKNFGIGKTTVKNLISVYENFKDSNGRLQEQFRDCSVSTLVELLPIADDKQLASSLVTLKSSDVRAIKTVANHDKEKAAQLTSLYKAVSDSFKKAYSALVPGDKKISSSVKVDPDRLWSAECVLKSRIGNLTFEADLSPSTGLLWDVPEEHRLAAYLFNDSVFCQNHYSVCQDLKAFGNLDSWMTKVVVACYDIFKKNSDEKSAADAEKKKAKAAKAQQAEVEASKAQQAEVEASKGADESDREKILGLRKAQLMDSHNWVRFSLNSVPIAGNVPAVLLNSHFFIEVFSLNTHIIRFVRIPANRTDWVPVSDSGDDLVYLEDDLDLDAYWDVDNLASDVEGFPFQEGGQPNDCFDTKA